MKTLLRWLAVTLVSLFAATGSFAQARYSQAELDQMLAPIALYPDNVLSQLLMAGPLFGLFNLSIILVWLIERARRKKLEALEKETGADLVPSG